MKIEIVRFSKDEFAVRVRESIFFPPRYVDLQDMQHMWAVESSLFKYCIGTLKQCRFVKKCYEDRIKLNSIKPVVIE